MSFSSTRPAIFRTAEPDEDDLRSFLLSFRRFVSQSEPLYIENIHQLCFRHLKNDELREQMKRCRAGWKQNVQRSEIKFAVDGRDLTPTHVADLWINGFYFQDDPVKAAELRSYVIPASLLIRHTFLNFVAEATRVVGATAFTLRAAIREGAVGE